MHPSNDRDRKCYAQFCPLATALDVVGDRWTMLILRELLGGPARFHELRDGLPGIAKNLLTERLRRLESDELVRRVTTHGVTLYALTELGAAIRPALEELGIWGLQVRPLAPPEHERSVRAIAMALHSILVRAGDALPATPYLVEVEVAGEPVEITLGPQPTVTARPGSNADARIQVPGDTMSDLLLGRPFNADDFVLVAGDPGARTALLGALSAMFATA